jgi:hypothetical protein
MQTPRRENLAFANLQRVNDGPTRCLPLFFVSPRPTHPQDFRGEGDAERC